MDIKSILRGPYRWLALRWVGLNHVGESVYVHPSVRVINPSRVYLADQVHVLGSSLLQCEMQGCIEIGYHTRVDHHVTLQANGGHISLGTFVYVGPFSILRGDGGLEIGNDVLISPQVIIMSANHIYKDRTRLIREQGETRLGICIEDDVWIGAGAKVLDGVTVGRGAVIGAGAVVTRDVPCYSVAVGVPARVVELRQPTS